MSIIRIASRYAKSLLDLAVEQNALEDVLKDVNNFSEVVKNRDFYLLVKSPIISTSKKEDVFESLFKGKYHKLTTSFFNIILKKGREKYLPEIASSFLEQYKVLKHISTVKLITASPLDKGQLEHIKSKLLASDVTDEKVEIETEVDPNIIGGFVIEIGDKLYDASVAHKLEQFKKEFSSNKFVKN